MLEFIVAMFVLAYITIALPIPAVTLEQFLKLILLIIIAVLVIVSAFGIHGLSVR